jgi:hypothetical protein
MSGLEIFGAITAAIGLISALAKPFGTRNNQPQELKRLRTLLDFLNDEYLLAKATIEEKRRIHEMINACTDVLESRSRDKSPGVWRHFWPTDADAQLKLHNDLISEELKLLQGRLSNRFGGLSLSATILHRHASNNRQGRLCHPPLENARTTAILGNERYPQISHWCRAEHYLVSILL